MPGMVEGHSLDPTRDALPSGNQVATVPSVYSPMSPSNVVPNSQVVNSNNFETHGHNSLGQRAPGNRHNSLWNDMGGNTTITRGPYETSLKTKRQLENRQKDGDTEDNTPKRVRWV